MISRRRREDGRVQGRALRQLARRHRVDRILARKQPGLGPRRPPPVAQQFEQLRGEHHVAIPLPLALLDPQGHALAVDVGHLQRHDLGHAQARAVGAARPLRVALIAFI